MEPKAYADLSNYELENIAKRRINDYYRLNTYNRVDDSRQPIDRNSDDSKFQDKYLELFYKYDINLQILLDLLPTITDDLKKGLDNLVEDTKHLHFEEPEELEDLDISNHWTNDIAKKLDQDVHNAQVNKISNIMRESKKNPLDNSLMLKLVDVSAKASQQGQQLFGLSEKLLSVDDMTDEYLRKFKKNQKTLIEYQEDFFNEVEVNGLFDALTNDKKGKITKKGFTAALGRHYDTVMEIYENTIDDIDNLVKMNDDVILQHDNVIGIESVVSKDNKLIAGRRSMPIRFM